MWWVLVFHECLRSWVTSGEMEPLLKGINMEVTLATQLNHTAVCLCMYLQVHVLYVQIQMYVFSSSWTFPAIGYSNYLNGTYYVHQDITWPIFMFRFYISQGILPQTQIIFEPCTLICRVLELCTHATLSTLYSILSICRNPTLPAVTHMHFAESVYWYSFVIRYTNWKVVGGIHWTFIRLIMSTILCHNNFE